MTIRQSPDPNSAPVAGQNGPTSGLNPTLASIDPPEAPSSPQGGLVADCLPSLLREQLLHLTARAERGALTPDEGRLLRDGVQQLWAELVAAQRQAAALSPLVVACPTCEAPAASRCRAVSGVRPPRVPHSGRLSAAGRWLFAEALRGGAE